MFVTFFTSSPSNRGSGTTTKYCVIIAVIRWCFLLRKYCSVLYSCSSLSLNFVQILYQHKHVWTPNLSDLSACFWYFEPLSNAKLSRQKRLQFVLPELLLSYVLSQHTTFITLLLYGGGKTWPNLTIPFRIVRCLFCAFPSPKCRVSRLENRAKVILCCVVQCWRVSCCDFV